MIHQTAFLGIMAVPAVVEGFGYHCALQGDILGITARETFVDGPGYGAVVDNGVVGTGGANAVGCVGVRAFAVPVVTAAKVQSDKTDY